MPIYTIRCDHCESQEDVFRSLAQMDDLPDCCGESMHRVMCAPMVVTDYAPYQSMVTGEMIEGRAAHKEHLRRHNVVEAADMKPTPKPQTLPGGLKEKVAQAVYQKLSY